jgi:hypothetical protein
LAHAAAAAVFTLMQESLGGAVQPGLVARLASADDLVHWLGALSYISRGGEVASALDAACRAESPPVQQGGL